MEVDAAAYPLPPSAGMSPRSGAQSPARSLSFDYPLHSHSSSSSDAASPATSARSLGPDSSGSTVNGRSRSALAASLAMTPSSRTQQLAQVARYSTSHPTSGTAEEGTIEPYSAHSLAYANSQLTQYLAQVGLQQQQQQQQQQHQQQQQQQQQQQRQDPLASAPGYLNPHALSNALSDYASMQVEDGTSLTWAKATAASAPTSAGGSPPDTPHLNPRKRVTSHQYSGASTTGSATPLHLAHHHHPQTSRVAASPITGKRLNWGEMIVHTIADSEDGRLVVHDLFERMAERFPEICEWAHGDGWEGRVKNRIKSTLSIKSHLFVKVARDASTPRIGPGIDTSKSKGSWWTLSAEAQTAWKEGRVATVVKAKHHGGDGRSSRSGASSAATSRRSSPSRARSARGVASGHQKSIAHSERSAAGSEPSAHTAGSTQYTQPAVRYSASSGQNVPGESSSSQQHSPASMVQAAVQLPSSHSYLFAHGQHSGQFSPDSLHNGGAQGSLNGGASTSTQEGVSEAPSMTLPWQTDVTALGLRYLGHSGGLLSHDNPGSPPWAHVQRQADEQDRTRASMSPDRSSASASGSASGSSGGASGGRPLNNVSLTLPVGSGHSPVPTNESAETAVQSHGNVPGNVPADVGNALSSGAPVNAMHGHGRAVHHDDGPFDTASTSSLGLKGSVDNASQPQLSMESPQQGGYEFSYDYAPLSGDTDINMLRMGNNGMGDLDLSAAVMSMPGLHALDLNDMAIDYSSLGTDASQLADFGLHDTQGQVNSGQAQSPSSQQPDRYGWTPG